MIKEILEKISIYQRNGSGWYFKEVSSLEIHISCIVVGATSVYFRPAF